MGKAFVKARKTENATRKQRSFASYLLMVWEVLHGLEEQVSDVCQEPHRHPSRQVLLGEVEDAGAGRQLHGQVQRVVPHADHHQLQHKFGPC